MNKLLANIRKQINTKLYNLGRSYYRSIPFDEIEDILDQYGLIALQEDNTKWSGLFMGREAHQQHIAIGHKNSINNGFYTPIDNSILVLSWYQMPSGRYEINPYVS